MPPVSEKQRRYLWAKHPEIMRRWAREGKSTVRKKRKKSRSKKGKKGKKK